VSRAPHALLQRERVVPGAQQRLHVRDDLAQRRRARRQLGVVRVVSTRGGRTRWAARAGRAGAAAGAPS